MAGTPHKTLVGTDKVIAFSSSRVLRAVGREYALKRENIANARASAHAIGTAAAQLVWAFNARRVCRVFSRQEDHQLRAYFARSAWRRSPALPFRALKLVTA